MQHEVTFSVVGVERRPAKRAAKPPAPRPRPAPDRARYYDAPRFPLAGPILGRSTGRMLRGVCGRCNTRLRVRVRTAGAVRVTCPICGHARRIQT